MSRETLEVRICDRCGASAKAAPDSSDFGGWAVLSMRQGSTLLGHGGAGDDLCGDCWAAMLAFYNEPREKAATERLNSYLASKQTKEAAETPHLFVAQEHIEQPVLVKSLDVFERLAAICRDQQELDLLIDAAGPLRDSLSRYPEQNARFLKIISIEHTRHAAEAADEQ